MNRTLLSIFNVMNQHLCCGHDNGWSRNEIDEREANGHW